MPEAERHLWARLRARRFGDWKFRRQHRLGRYIVDFVCLKSRLIIEVDGGTHGNDLAERLDAERTNFLNWQGFRVLRFWNHEVYEEMDSVTEAIWNALNDSLALRAPLPNPLP